MSTYTEYRKQWYKANHEKIKQQQREFYRRKNPTVLRNPADVTLQFAMRRRLQSIRNYLSRDINPSDVKWLDEPMKELKNYTERFYIYDDIKEANAQAFRTFILDNYIIMESEKPKKPKISLLQRKTKKIESDLAKIAAKAEAFRVKLAAGYVVEIVEHKFD